MLNRSCKACIFSSIVAGAITVVFGEGVGKENMYGPKIKHSKANHVTTGKIGNIGTLIFANCTPEGTKITHKMCSTGALKLMNRMDGAKTDS